jgi:NAD(P)-dependent dehydrogenase (short-subunit alcohol dehydrogenase family)
MVVHESLSAPSGWGDLHMGAHRKRIYRATTVITGASSGVGQAAALAFARGGARVVLAARNPEQLRLTEAAVRAAGAEVLVVSTDVTDEASVGRLVREALDRFGRIDIVVCNAGVYVRGAVRDLALADIERCMAVNYYGTVHLIRAALPHLLAQGSGHIVAVTSVDGKKGLPPDAAYVASKFAATGFMDVLRQELRGTGVYASTILPGRVDTPMIAALDVPLVSAKISSERVARSIVRAVCQRRREIVIPFSGPKALIVLSSIWAGVGDWLVRMLKLEGRENGAEKRL